MSYDAPGPGGLDYAPCRFRGSRMLFRGPERAVDGAFVACLGGTETYGKYVRRPWPARLEAVAGLPCLNFGSVNAGIDSFLNEPAVLEAAQAAQVVVVQAMGAQNLSNRFYAVHPRRNDRFLGPRPLMARLFPEADFTEFHFTRHMTGALAQRAPESFARLRAALRATWVARMTELIDRLGVPVVLLWLGQAAPPDTAEAAEAPEPLFVDRAMIEALRPRLAAVVEAPPAATGGAEGMAVPPLEAPAAAALPGPAAHAAAAEALLPVVGQYLPQS
ncbi:hypothetical protein DRV84_05385 [Rhodosalinus sediminis]|uniref:DUF6473 domain-containing protein n=1 Tax=Rhodosalinus sediminis TaxID=1940533 RepID=A0A3D9BXA9_9RHOB|nr:DUF6473 family protein [Rhodosalinus sediminis]REC58016.1 hypothetical protein DRV84_05385 [Rhodosalinus sediminis]